MNSQSYVASIGGAKDDSTASESSNCYDGYGRSAATCSPSAGGRSIGYLKSLFAVTNSLKRLFKNIFSFYSRACWYCAKS